KSSPEMRPFWIRLVLARVDTTSAVNLPLSAANSRPVPGAVRVGALPSPAGRCDFGTPRDEKLARPPSLVPAATLITQGAWASGLIVSLPGPELPAAKTTTIPRSCAVLAATMIGSLGLNAPCPPQELEMTRML